MNVVIVGGAGFLGGRLFDAITNTRSDCEARIYDVVPPRDREATASWSYADVTKPETLRGAFKDVQVVYYKTGLMGPEHSFEDPLRFHALNVEGAIRVLHECLAEGVEHFIYDSTVCVFGHSNRAPFQENESPAPASIYGATKTACENHLRLLAGSGSTQVTVLRYPRVVSAENSTVFRALANRLRTGEEIVLTARGERRFDVVHIDDVIHWNLWLLDNRISATLHVTSGVATCARQILEGLTGSTAHSNVRLTDETTWNERLLPDPCVLDDRRSRSVTGLVNRHTHLEDFLALF